MHNINTTINTVADAAATAHLLSLVPLALLLPHIASQPHGGEQEEANASANGPDVVRPRGAEEAGVSVVARWDHWDGGGALQEGPSDRASLLVDEC